MSALGKRNESVSDSFAKDLEALDESDSGDEVQENDMLNDLEDSDEEDDFAQNNDSNTQNNIGSAAFTSSNISSLRNSDRYVTFLKKLQQADDNATTGQLNSISSEDPEYNLVVESNQIIVEIDEDISNTYRFVVNLYSKKFPELETLIPNKIDYIRTLRRIGNEMDMTLVELNDLLPSATVMVVSVTGSTTNGEPLLSEDLGECMRGCAEVEQLVSDRNTILQFVESRMTRIAPNVCNIVGTRIAAQLLGLVGGLMALSRIPACNVQVLGQEKQTQLAGFSSTATMPHTGLIYNCEMVQNYPPFIRKKVLKMVSAKLALAARVDSYQNHPDGSEGLRLREEVAERVEKVLEPAKARTKKALPIPEEKKKSRRGGKRVRRFKERFEMTELRKQQNKMNVSITDGEYGDSAMGVNLTMLSASDDTGKMRAPTVKNHSSLLNKKQKKAVANVSSGNSNGLSSSLVFTPVQGLELVNPNANDKVKEANNKWFNSSSGFLSAVPGKM